MAFENPKVRRTDTGSLTYRQIHSRSCKWDFYITTSLLAWRKQTQIVLSQDLFVFSFVFYRCGFILKTFGYILFKTWNRGLDSYGEEQVVVISWSVKIKTVCSESLTEVGTKQRTLSVSVLIMVVLTICLSCGKQVITRDTNGTLSPWVKEFPFSFFYYKQFLDPIVQQFSFELIHDCFVYCCLLPKKEWYYFLCLYVCLTVPLIYTSQTPVQILGKSFESIHEMNICNWLTFEVTPIQDGHDNKGNT